MVDWLLQLKDWQQEKKWEGRKLNVKDKHKSYKKTTTNKQVRDEEIRPRLSFILKLSPEAAFMLISLIVLIDLIRIVGDWTPPNMSDKAEVNLSGARGKKGVWLVKVRRNNELFLL